ncbi:MAG: hypothetical protein DRN20_04775 [Thermoplasmata archaeon]|nr:MAG: hypothetical protein DRN20_04775 [Thermoplasmata archaeon]
MLMEGKIMATVPTEEMPDKIRLAKLWNAYEMQEKELEKAKERIKELEKALEERDALIQTLKETLDARDDKIRELEVKLAQVEKEHAKCPERISALEKEVKTERERFAKLYALAEELEADIKKARKEIEARDKWFKENIDVLRRFAKALEERLKIIEGEEKV